MCTPRTVGLVEIDNGLFASYSNTCNGERSVSPSNRREGTQSYQGTSVTEKIHSICSKYILIAGLALTSLLTGVGLALATGLLGGVAVIAIANPLIAINAVAVLVIAGVIGLIAAGVLALRASK